MGMEATDKAILRDFGWDTGSPMGVETEVQKASQGPQTLAKLISVDSTR